MSMTDPIADLLTTIRNGLSAKKRWVDIPSSNFKKRIIFVLKEENYIKDFFFIKDGVKEKVRIFLKYDFKGNSVIEIIKINCLSMFKIGLSRPRGPMDKASAYGAGDCRFESCRGHWPSC